MPTACALSVNHSTGAAVAAGASLPPPAVRWRRARTAPDRAEHAAGGRTPSSDVPALYSGCRRACYRPKPPSRRRCVRCSLRTRAAREASARGTIARSPGRPGTPRCAGATTCGDRRATRARAGAPTRPPARRRSAHPVPAMRRRRGGRRSRRPANRRATNTAGSDAGSRPGSPRPRTRCSRWRASRLISVHQFIGSVAPHGSM